MRQAGTALIESGSEEPLNYDAERKILKENASVERKVAKRGVRFAESIRNAGAYLFGNN